MSSLIDRLRKTKNEPESPSPAEPVAPATPPPEFAGPADEAEGYLRAVSDKMMKLAEDFALGRVNRAQFEELYRHYLDERAAIERLLETQPGTPAWKGAVTEGESVLIKRKHAASRWATRSISMRTPCRCGAWAISASTARRWRRCCRLSGRRRRRSSARA